MTTAAEVFHNIESRLNADKAKKIGSSYLFDIGGEGGGKWFADLTKAEGPWIVAGEGADPKCTITVAKAEDWVSIATGKMNPTMAFMQGKIKVKGDMSLAMKLQTLLS